MFGVTNSFLPPTRAFQTTTYAKVTALRGLSGRLGDYTLLKKLGEGSFGSVWLSETVMACGERALVAIKAVRRARLICGLVSLIHEEQQLTKFFTDIDAGLGYFPQIVESFTDENNYYIVQEYMPGGTLREEMERNGGRLTVDRAKFVLAQLITIVKRMHELGVMHRDIKPENILLDAAGNIVLTDLGLARRFCSLHEAPEGLVASGPILMSHDGCGTPGYMAPEVLYDDTHTYPVDMYSLGVVFYEMIFGILPFPQYDPNRLAYAMLNNLFAVPIGGLDPTMASLMLSLLTIEPKRRITVWQAMAHPFFRDIDWHRVAHRKYAVPVEWAPPISRIDRRKTIDKSILIDRLRVRKSFAHRRPTRLDRAFVTPRRTPTVKRPGPPPQLQNRQRGLRRKVIGALRLAGIRREAAQTPSPSPTLSPPLPAAPIRVEADIEIQTMNKRSESFEEGEIVMNQPRSLEEGEVVEETDMHLMSVYVSPVPVPARTPAIAIPGRTAAIAIPNARAAPVETAPAAVYSAFEVSIELLDEILLSSPAGMGPGRVLAFQAPPSLPSPPTSAFAPMQVVQGHLAPPTVPALDALGTSPPVTPGPVTPVSGRSRVPEFGLTSKERHYLALSLS